MQSDHQRLDARSLAMHRLIAERIQSNPHLLDKVTATLTRWRKLHPDLSCNQEWAQWLAKPLQELLEFMREDSETATRLRQSSPFCGIISDQERRQFIESFSARTYYSCRQRDSG